MNARRVLTYADTEEQAEQRRLGWLPKEPDAQVQEGTWPNTNQRWAVTAARVKKGAQQ